MTGWTARVRHCTHTVAGCVAGCVLVACLLAGCSSVRSNLGTSESACYLALPTASHSVPVHSRLAGVHLFTLSGLRRDIPHLFTRLSIAGRAAQRLCVFEYTGAFVSASVTRPFGSARGRFAVVVVSTPANRLLGTVILDHPPYRFEHTHIG